MQHQPSVTVCGRRSLALVRSKMRLAQISIFLLHGYFDATRERSGDGHDQATLPTTIPALTGKTTAATDHAHWQVSKAKYASWLAR